MTNEEADKLEQDLQEFLERQKEKRAPKRTKRRGIYSKIIVALCVLLAVSYTGICLLMQYRTGTQPEPQLTIAFFAFISAELWNLAKIKRHKEDVNKNE